MVDLAPNLPAGTIGPVVNDEFGLVAVATIALWSDGFTMEEMRETARDIRDELYELEGIRKVELWGVHDERVFLEYSSAKLAQLGVSIQDIVRTLTEQNIVLPGGRWEVAGQDLIIEPSGNFRSVEDIEESGNRGARYRAVGLSQGSAERQARLRGSARESRVLQRQARDRYQRVDYSRVSMRWILASG